MTKPARDSMSNHRRPDSLTHDESETRTADTTHYEIRLLPRKRVHNEISTPLTTTTAHGFGEIRTAPQSIRLR